MAVCVICGKEYTRQPHNCLRRVGPHGEVVAPNVFVPSPAEADSPAPEPHSLIWERGLAKDIPKQGRVTSTSPPAPAAAIVTPGLGPAAAGPFSKPRAATKKKVAEKKVVTKKAPAKGRAPKRGKK